MLISVLNDLYRINREMNTLLYDDVKSVNTYWPGVNIYENEAEYIAVAKVPGIDKNEISISFKDNSLKISGEKKSSDQEKANYHLNERKNGKFERIFLINEKIDADKINAEIKNGLLLIKIPKSPESKPVKINIK